MRRTPLAFYFLFAWAAYAMFLTAAAAVWAYMQKAGPGYVSLPEYVDLAVLMGTRAAPGVVLYALYFVLVRPQSVSWRQDLRIALNWMVFAVLGAVGFIGAIILFENGDPFSAMLDLAPILLSSALAMLLPGQTRRVLFQMKGLHEKQSQ